ncbi:MAG: DUF2088 domain-containing protein, partial [Thermoplasmata archaeon]|nr:DUF2088 domain-containing protein [Thermoplasmata archaeon]
MNLVKIHYSGKEIEAEIPKEAQFDVLKKSTPPKPMSDGEIRDFVEKIAGEMPDRGVTLVMNDHNRATRTDAVLRAGWSVFRESIDRVIIATGSHTPPTPDHLVKMLGEDLYSELKDRIRAHLALEDEHESLGETRRGTEVLLMKHFLSSSYVLFINSVEPHYFAGFTGGRKSILPGVSHYSTIEHNHSFALMPEAKTLALEGNPVHEDMMEAIGFVDIPHTSIQIVQSPEGRILNLYAGDIKESFYTAAERAKEVFTTSIKEPYDIVLAAVPPPMDLNLYQSQKGIENGKLALKEGGILIL